MNTDIQSESAAFWLRSQPETKTDEGWKALYAELAVRQGRSGEQPGIRPCDLPGYREHAERMDAEMEEALYAEAMKLAELVVAQWKADNAKSVSPPEGPERQEGVEGDSGPKGTL